MQEDVSETWYRVASLIRNSILPKDHHRALGIQGYLAHKKRFC